MSKKWEELSPQKSLDRNPLVTKGALLYLPIWQVMCALILFRELLDKSRSMPCADEFCYPYMRKAASSLFFLPRPFPLADLNIAVTLNVYTHVGLEDAEKELQKMQGLENARKEMGISDTDDKPLKQNMFKVV